MEALTGKEVWRHAYPTDYVDRYGYNGGPRCAPVIDGRGPDARVFALGPTGAIHALELASGKPVWSRDLEKELALEPNFFGVGAAPLIEGGLIILNLGGTDRGTGVVAALETASGKLVWKTATDGGSYAAPQAAEAGGVRRIFVFHRGGLSALDPAGGSETWRFAWQSRIYESVNAATPLITGDLLLLSASYGTGSAVLRLKKDAHEVVWQDDLRSREKRLDAHWSTPLILGGHIYGFGGRHEQGSALRCVELTTGAVRWSWESYLGRGSLIHSDGHQIALGERGDLALLKLGPDGHQELRRVRGVLRYPAWTPPVLANGILYLRDESVLMAMDLRPPSGAPDAKGDPGKASKESSK